MKLSIIIPTYNVEKYIRTTIASLIDQTQSDFEIVIVDDGSTDNTTDVIEEIIKENKLNNCSLIKKTNGGVSSARNVGIDAASGCFIMFLDGDDYVSIDLVENIYKYIDEKKSDIICFGCNIVDENQELISDYFQTFKLEQGYMTGVQALNNMINYKNLWIYTGSAAYKSELLTKYSLEYTEGCANGEDQEFTIKTLARAKAVAFIKKSLCFYVQRGSSISNSYNIKRFDTMAAIERTYEYLENLEDVEDIENLENLENLENQQNQENLEYLENTKNNELQAIATKIKDQHIVDNYIYNFDCCLDYIYKNGDFNSDSFKKLYADIQEAYPSSHSKVHSSMKTYSGSNFKIAFKVKTFLFSPALYIWIFTLKNKLKTSKIRK